MSFWCWNCDQTKEGTPAYISKTMRGDLNYCTDCWAARPSEPSAPHAPQSENEHKTWCSRYSVAPQSVSASHRNFICPTDEMQCDWPKCVDPKSGDSYFDAECLKRMNAVSGDAPEVDIRQKCVNFLCLHPNPKVDELKEFIEALRRYFPPASQTPPVDAFPEWWLKEWDDALASAQEYERDAANANPESGYAPQQTMTDEEIQVAQEATSTANVRRMIAEIRRLRVATPASTARTDALLEAAQIARDPKMWKKFTDRNKGIANITKAGMAIAEALEQLAAPGSVPQAPDNHSDLFFGNLQYSLQALFAKVGNPFKDLAEWGAVWEALESARKHCGVPQAEPPKESVLKVEFVPEDYFRKRMLHLSREIESLQLELNFLRRFFDADGQTEPKKVEEEK